MQNPVFVKVQKSQDIGKNHILGLNIQSLKTQKGDLWIISAGIDQGVFHFDVQQKFGQNIGSIKWEDQSSSITTVESSDLFIG